MVSGYYTSGGKGADLSSESWDLRVLFGPHVPAQSIHLSSHHALVYLFLQASNMFMSIQVLALKNPIFPGQHKAMQFLMLFFFFNRDQNKLQESFITTYAARPEEN